MSAKDWIFTRHENHGPLTQEGLQVLAAEAKLLAAQVETGEEGRTHIQGFVQLKSRKRLAQLNNIYPAHWEKRRGSAKQAYDYATKEETRTGWQFVKGDICGQGKRTDIEEAKDMVKRGATDLEMYEEAPSIMAKYPRFVQGYRRALAESRVEKIQFEPRYIWQRRLAEMLKEVPHPRRVIWRWENDGNVGKSYFARHALEESYYVTGGKHADIRYGYRYEPVIIFDWPRSNAEAFPYSLVEQFKNGAFFVEKYESRTIRFGIPHVVIFANFEPDKSQLSGDRWDIEKINVLHT